MRRGIEVSLSDFLFEFSAEISVENVYFWMKLTEIETEFQHLPRLPSNIRNSSCCITYYRTPATNIIFLTAYSCETISELFQSIFRVNRSGLNCSTFFGSRGTHIFPVFGWTQNSDFNKWFSCLETLMFSRGYVNCNIISSFTCTPWRCARKILKKNLLVNQSKII